MKPTFRVVLMSSILLAGLGAVGPVSADDAGVASVTQSAAAIDFRALGNADRLTLSVAVPDGRVLRQEGEAARGLTFSLFDRNGQRLPDGAYHWQLVASPRLSEESRAALAAARGTDREAAVIADFVRRGELPARPAVQSGAFRIEGGAIVSGDALEPGAGPRPRAVNEGPTLSTRDQVIPDDLIVQGSTCVGFDCVNNESFGFDTIRLKENNLRIKFEDTSVGAFPSNEWQLTANDSASGGANKFSIEDITGARVPFTVTAGAATNSIFVDSTGRVGLRTSTPVLDLHVNTSNTPALRLEQNNSGGFTAQTWDVAGNEANFFVRDVTSGSRLPLRIRPGAPTSSVDIAADGDVGFGTASPAAAIDVVRSGAAANLQVTTFSDTLRTDFVTRRARGTSGVPAAVQDNDVFGGILMLGHNGTTFTNAVSIDARAEQNWSATANGSRLVFQTIPNNSTTLTTRMVVRQDGRVGIGTTAPTDLLHVSGGNIRVTTGSFIDDGITLNVPDYVFEPGYELRTIEQLAEFVEENKHLPGVPSRQDVKQKGLNLSQFQMNLLEKVEELTLYTIDQHETITALEKRNAELEARLKAIEEALTNRP